MVLRWSFSLRPPRAVVPSVTRAPGKVYVGWGSGRSASDWGGPPDDFWWLGFFVKIKEEWGTRPDALILVLPAGVGARDDIKRFHGGKSWVKVYELGERGLIAAIHRLQKTPPRGYLGIGDDAAVLPPSGDGWLASSDMLVEGVHFRSEWVNPGHLGEKAVAVNLSDIAAMGGVPRGLLTSIGLPRDTQVDWVEAFYRGMAKALDEYGVVLLGGDTVGSPGPLIISVTVLGQVEGGAPVLRRGAKPGDRLVVTGRLGASRAGLALLQDGVRWPGRNVTERSVLTAHLMPKARVDAGLRLRPLAHAMTDISDGLVAELVELVQFGGIGARIFEEQLPVDGATAEVARRYRQDPRQWVYYGGEDYELLAAVPPSRLEEARERLSECQVSLTEVGVVTDTPGLTAVRPDGKEEPLNERGAFDHFQLVRVSSGG